MPTCPNGHQSGSDDWCEVCGHRMAGAVPPPPPPPPGGGYGFPPPAGPGVPGGGRPGGRPHPSAVPGAEPELCPQCRTPREGGAPFCEECRWNFLTNTATSYTPAAPRSPQPRFQPPSTTYGGGDGYDYQDSRPSRVNRPAEPIPSFGGEPSGPTPFAGERGPSAPQTAPGRGGPDGPSGFGGQRPSGPAPDFGRGREQGPDGFGGHGGSGGPGGPPGYGGGQERNPGGPGGPGGPPGYGGGQGQNSGRYGGPGGPGGHSAPPPFGREPSGFGADPSRTVPPPGPGGPGGAADGAPQAFRQSGPPAPPAFPRETGRPPADGPSFGGGDDDWVLPPPSSAGHGGRGGHGGSGGQGGPGAQGGYGYPQPGATQAPPGSGFPRARQGPVTWTATIGPDRDYFMAMMQRSGPEAAGLNLPAYSPEQQRTLTGTQVTIGRRRHSTGDTPDIDLSVPPEDPGVSHQHAVLVQQSDGSWAVVDQNSTNGTTVNGSDEPIQPFVPVPLQDGDRVHVGAWTTITIRRG
ncbi:FHA domain-containing protein [Streptomyces sp. TG1A-8]|uniref:FHA domain-containing protein n=1 Tax=Streptomyces sp. TG1A-8 TaxID=3051385 RepID=UPI00265C777E|nr:FHA domain-containing protein [Streptomyces sp. TG1A-8]MDO0927669.1 FHA domain-containing protein [Streptomyces sp. TG1A-8]